MSGHREVLRQAAEQFERAAALWFKEPDSPERTRWLTTYGDAADILHTWAINGGVPGRGRGDESVVEESKP